MTRSEPSPSDAAEACREAFAEARRRLNRAAPGEVLDWLEDTVHSICAGPPDGGGPEAPVEVIARAEAYFNPPDDCPGTIVRLFESAEESVDICVYTITHDVIASAVLAAHARGLRLRIVTDDEKLAARGSDVRRFAAAGIPVRTDGCEYQMHNKFAVFDGRVLVTGSYNWTRRAGECNQENFIVTDDRRVVARFADYFERLWRDFQANPYVGEDA